MGSHTSSAQKDKTIKLGFPKDPEQFKPQPDLAGDSDLLVLHEHFRQIDHMERKLVYVPKKIFKEDLDLLEVQKYFSQLLLWDTSESTQ